MRCSSTARCLVLLLVVVPILAQTTTAPTQTKSDVHKLSEINAYDIVAILIMGIGLAMAAAGGVGGGTIIVPLLVLVMEFDIKYATAASNFIIMGGAVANGIFNLRKRHPFVDRPLIDPDICLAMIPSMMGGAVIGAVLSKTLPSYVISILFVLLLTVSVFRTTQKGIELHRREKAKDENSTNTTTTNHSPPTVSPQETPLVPFVQQTSSPSSSSVAVEVKDQDLQRKIEQLQESERHFSWKKHLLILVSYLGIVAASIGGKVLPCGSWKYWVLLWAELPWVFGFTILFVVYMNKQRAYKVAIGFPFAPGDMEWTRKVILWFPLGCMFAGVAAGLFGVGGAIIAGPLMLELGIVPEVASSSSALMVLYSSAAATTKFAVFDQIVWDWSILLCGMAFIVTTVAQIFILGFVRRTGRQSVIVFCIASSIGFGTVLMAYSAIKTTIKTAGQPFKVQFCSKQG